MKINEYLSIAPSPTGYEVRIYHENSQYCSINMTTEEATSMVEFIFDIAQARKMGIMSVEETMNKEIGEE